MKFKLLSDLHLEFYGRTTYMGLDQPMWKPEMTDEDAETVLLLAGDIHVGFKAKEWIKDMCTRFHHVVYILGNHEFYNNELYAVKEGWHLVDMPDNFTYLDDGVVYFDNVRVVGGTLWTQVTDPFMVWTGPKRMTDYQVTTVREYGKLRRMNVADTNKEHFETINAVTRLLAEEWAGKTVVMTHHLPHELCVHEFYKENSLNAFFMTDLDHVIKNFDIDVWCHGHTHTCVDVEVHGTRILCNPMGYHGVQLNQDFNEGLIFEC